MTWPTPAYGQRKLMAETSGEGCELGSYAFSGCKNLADIELPDNLTTIGECAFESTPWLEGQPDGVVYVGNILYTYKGTMPANTSIAVREGTTSISSNALVYYGDGESPLVAVSLPSTLKTIGSGAFSYCVNLHQVTFPEGLTTIEGFAFEGSGLTSVRLPASLTSLGPTAFNDCQQLAELYVADSPDTLVIGGSAGVWICSTSPLERLYLGRYVKHHYVVPGYIDYVGRVSFGGEELKELVIGRSIEALDRLSFGDNYNLTDITVLNDVPPVAEADRWYFDSSVQERATLHVPEGALSAYAAADVWKDFLNIAGEDLTGIDDVTTAPAAAAAVRHYDLSGRPVDPQAKGIHVVLMDDGTARKVVVR